MATAPTASTAAGALRRRWLGERLPHAGPLPQRGEVAGIAALYEEEAVMADPPGQVTVGRDAIRALWEKVLAQGGVLDQPEFQSIGR